MPMYTLSPMSTTLANKTIHIEHAPGTDKLSYRVLKADGSVAEGVISALELGVDFKSFSSVDEFNPYVQDIIDLLVNKAQIDAEVASLFTVTAHGDSVAVGVTVYEFTDPTDPEYVYLRPEFYVKNDTPSLPRHVMVITDVSGSMDGIGIGALHSMLPKLSTELEPTDRLSLVKFSNDITPLASGLVANIKTEFAMQSAHLKAEDGTALNDAILFVANKTMNPDLIPSHTTVLLLTDGQEGASRFTAAPGDVIKEYTKRFAGKPPRIIPIGLGASYDRGFMLGVAKATKGGMIDARDQSLLDRHIESIKGALAYGIHIDVSVGAATHHSLGILNYNTINKQTPLRVKKSDAMASGLNLDIAGTSVHIKPEHFIAASKSTRTNGLQNYLVQQAKDLYDTDATLMSLEQKIAAIEELITNYKSLGLLQDVTEMELTTLLLILDKKRIAHICSQFASAHAQTYDKPSVLQAVFDKAKSDGRLATRFEENKAYIDKAISHYLQSSVETSGRSMPTATMGMSFLTQTISRAPGYTGVSEIEVDDRLKANRFTGTGSLSSSTPFTVRMSVMGGGYGIPKADKELRLDRSLDFTCLGPNILVRSEFTGREVVTLDCGAPYLDKAVREIAVGSHDINELLSRALAHVAGLMSTRDLSVLGLTLNEHLVLPLADVLKAGVGVSRHHSLYTAGILGKLVQEVLNQPARDGIINVTHYRAVNNNLIAHSCAVLTQQIGAIKKTFIVDSIFNICEEISSQADFERCVQRYNDKGMYWFLRAFAKTHAFAYPEAEDEQPIGAYAIARLQLAALTNFDVMNDLRRLGIIPTGTSLIEQTTANKKIIWDRLITLGYTLPEEITEEKLKELCTEAEALVQRFAAVEVAAAELAAKKAAAAAVASDGAIISKPSPEEKQGQNTRHQVGYYETIGTRPAQEDALCWHPLDKTAVACESPKELAERVWTAIHNVNESIKINHAPIDGSTASTTLIKDNHLITATTGDACAFAFIYNKDGTVSAVKRLNSRTHKASDPDEIERINAAGGFVGNMHIRYPFEEAGFRTSAILALSRSIGDYGYKGVSASSQMDVFKLPADAFKIQVGEMCDGATDGAGVDAQEIEDHEAFMLRGLQSLNGGYPGLLSEAEVAKGLAHYALAQKYPAGHPAIALLGTDAVVNDNVSVLVQTVKSEGKSAAQCALMGVYDGHGGGTTSGLIAETIGAEVVRQLKMTAAEYAAQPMSVINQAAEYLRDNAALDVKLLETQTKVEDNPSKVELTALKAQCTRTAAIAQANILSTFDGKSEGYTNVQQRVLAQSKRVQECIDAALLAADASTKSARPETLNTAHHFKKLILEINAVTVARLESALLAALKAAAMMCSDVAAEQNKALQNIEQDYHRELSSILSLIKADKEPSLKSELELLGATMLLARKQLITAEFECLIDEGCQASTTDAKRKAVHDAQLQLNKESDRVYKRIVSFINEQHFVASTSMQINKMIATLTIDDKSSCPQYDWINDIANKGSQIKLRNAAKELSEHLRLLAQNLKSNPEGKSFAVRKNEFLVAFNTAVTTAEKQFNEYRGVSFWQHYIAPLIIKLLSFFSASYEKESKAHDSVVAKVKDFGLFRATVCIKANSVDEMDVDNVIKANATA